jgi:hypothetical protein
MYLTQISGGEGGTHISRLMYCFNYRFFWPTQAVPPKIPPRPDSDDALVSCRSCCSVDNETGDLDGQSSNPKSGSELANFAERSGLARRFGQGLSVPRKAGTEEGAILENATHEDAMTKRHEAKYKIDRRMGQNVWGRPKSPVNRREYGPGQHGQRCKSDGRGSQMSAQRLQPRFPVAGPSSIGNRCALWGIGPTHNR